jgi:hypothetical protein
MRLTLLIGLVLLASTLTLVGTSTTASARIDKCTPPMVSNPAAHACVDYGNINDWCVTVSESGSGGTHTAQKCEHFVGPV